MFENIHDLWINCAVDFPSLKQCQTEFPVSLVSLFTGSCVKMTDDSAKSVTKLIGSLSFNLRHFFLSFVSAYVIFVVARNASSDHLVNKNLTLKIKISKTKKK